LRAFVPTKNSNICQDRLGTNIGKVGSADCFRLLQVLAMLALVPEIFGGVLQVIPFVRDSNYLKRPHYLKVMGKFATDASTFWGYSLFWLAIIGGKCYFSYYYEIRSQVRNSATTWKAMATPFASEELMVDHGAPAVSQPFFSRVLEPSLQLSRACLDKSLN
jgi:hypothetical protein